MRLVLLGLCCVLPSFAFAAGNSTAVQVALAKQSGISEELAKRQIEQVVSAIRSELVEGRDVTITNFGKFYVSEQKPKLGRNPKTGQPIEIPAKRYPRFTSADSFKSVMNPKAPAVAEPALQVTVAK